MTDVFAMAAAERRGLADTLDGLSDEQWAQPSLCTNWRVRDVVAHLVWPAETPMRSIMVKMALKGFNFDKAADAAARGDTRTNQQLASALRSNADSRFKPPGMGPEAPLTDIVVHGYDIRRPLGIDYVLDRERGRIVLDFLVSKKAAKGFGQPKGLTDGLRFEATDNEWSHGTGPTVKGATGALALVLTGRRAALESLEGDGAGELARRLSAN